MEIFEIWSTTKNITGKSGAFLHGTIEAYNFRDACIKLAKNNNDFYSYFNSKDMTFVGCKLFDNQYDAESI